VPSLRLADVAVICAMADPSAIDAWEPAFADERSLRTAPDELLVIASPERRTVVRNEAERELVAIDPHAVVADVTDGWTAWQLDDEDVRSAFARLSALPLPPDGWVQGDVAHVAAKVIAEPQRILVIVPSYWSDHLRDRILADSGATEVST
jgi:hypothetical protein